MKTAHKFLTLATSILFLPMIAPALYLGVPEELILVALVTYTATLIKALSI